MLLRTAFPPHVCLRLLYSVDMSQDDLSRGQAMRSGPVAAFDDAIRLSGMHLSQGEFVGCTKISHGTIQCCMELGPLMSILR